MIAFVLRRLLQGVPTLVGVLVLTWFLFFQAVSPQVMARRNLTSRAPSQQEIQTWLHEHGYDRPWQEQLRRSTVDLLLLRFGRSDASGEDILQRVRSGAGPSLVVAGSIFIGQLLAAVWVALLAAAFRGTYLDRTVALGCTALISIVYMVYVIGLQYVLGRAWNLGPVWGFDPDSPFRYVFVPSLTGILAGVAQDIRLYRTFFLEEIGQDYVRTARAKGVPEHLVLLCHVLRNALVPLITNNVAIIPTLILGGILLENFYGIPGLGSLLVNAIATTDFAVVRAMVFLGAALYIVGLILTDIAYAAADPRVRLE